MDLWYSGLSGSDRGQGESTSSEDKCWILGTPPPLQYHNIFYYIILYCSIVLIEGKFLRWLLGYRVEGGRLMLVL